MKLIRGLSNIATVHQGCVVTIGNFDGVHLGHQALIAKVQHEAAVREVPSLVIIFEPQPNEFFACHGKPARLMRWREKYHQLKRDKIHYLLTISFNQKFAKLTAVQFIEKILLEKLHVNHVILGDDFQFGFQRQGNFALLQRYKSFFSSEKMPSVVIQHERVSSTRIRNALQVNDHDLASKLLGRPYSMMGKVIHGDKRGRLLGFPTANMAIQRSVSPLHGIYAVEIQIENDMLMPGVASIGTRPSIPGSSHYLLEVYIFDFNQEIYGKSVCVHFYKKIRDERYFENLDLLIKAMHQDVADAKEFLKIKN